MNRATILEICNNVAIQLRFDELETVVGNTDKNAKFLLLAVTRGLYRNVYRYHPWSRLRRRHTVQVRNGETQYSLPGDFGYYVDNTAQRVDERNRHIGGPYTAEQWEDIVANGREEWDGGGSSMGFSFAGDLNEPVADPEDKSYIYVHPVPAITAPTDVFRFIYITDRIIQSVEGYTASRFESDGDKPNFDEELVECAGAYWGLRMLGLNYQDEKAELGLLLKREASRDSSRQPSDLASNMSGVTRFSVTGRRGVLLANTPGYYRSRGW